MNTIKALVRGGWRPSLEDTPDLQAEFDHQRDRFRHRVTANGSSDFPAEAGRYRLYVSYACPWAHRTILYRSLKGLKDVVAMSVLHPRWGGPQGWSFADTGMSTIDHACGRDHLYEIYQAAAPDFSGRVTVPVLWDERTRTIVNNESGDIIRMLNSAFDAVGGDPKVDYYPADLRDEIDRLNAFLLPDVCAGVYRAGFARSQEAHETAVARLFAALDTLEDHLCDARPFLLGERITECDWHLFACLCRFDAVYHGALKCNLRRLIDYPFLSAYTRRVHAYPGVADTVRFDHIKAHYYDLIGDIDPTIVPLGPAVDYVNFQADAPSVQTFVREVFDLHGFLERWLKGEVPHERRGPTRLEAALADDFIAIHPDGTRMGKAGILRNFAAAYGEKPACYAMDITVLSTRMMGDGQCLVTYRESHRGEPGRARLSSALLRRHAGREVFKWLFLQETLVADDNAETQSPSSGDGAAEYASARKTVPVATGAG